MQLHVHLATVKPQAHPGAARVTSTSVKSTTQEIFTPKKSKLPMGDNNVKNLILGPFP